MAKRKHGQGRGGPTGKKGNQAPSAPTVITSDQFLAMFGHNDVPAPEVVAHYLATGESPYQFGNVVLRQGLTAEVQKQAQGRRQPRLPPKAKTEAAVEGRLSPMVCAMFPKKEQAPVLDYAKKAAVFLTMRNTLHAIEHIQSDLFAWRIANIYLCSIGAETTAKEPFFLAGTGTNNAYYVPATYFRKRKLDPYAELLVHEAAHLLHSAFREDVGLTFTPQRPFLVPIRFAMSEVFAYCCEIYSVIADLTENLSDRKRLYGEYTNHAKKTDTLPMDERVPQDTYLHVLSGAVSVKNGWRHILKQCSLADGEKMDHPDAEGIEAHFK